jgi:tetratricopeptide (TPR) repeat protein
MTLIKLIMVTMKKLRLRIVFLLSLLLLTPVVLYADSRALTHFSMGYYYLYNDELESSLDQFELSLLFENNPPALLFSVLAEISNILENTEDALRYAKMALRIEPQDESALQTISLVYISANQYDKAVPFLNELLKNQPDDIQVLLYLAEAYNNLEDDDKLIDIYNQILNYHPNFIDVALNLGYLYTKKGAFGLAEIEFERVLELDPGNEKALFYLTYIYISEGKTDEALGMFESLDDKDLLNEETLQDYALNLFIEGQDPTPVLRRIEDWENVLPALQGVRHYSEGNLEEALTVFTHVLLEEPDNLAALNGLVRIAEQQGMWDAELRWRFRLAGSYYRLGRYEKAEIESQQVRQMDPGFLENRYLLGDIYGSLRETGKAIEEYEFFRRHAEEPGDIHIKLGLAYDQNGDHEEAIENFSRATQLFPENDELLYYLGIEYRIIMDYESAIEVFKRATQLNDQDARYFFHIGVSYERLGRIDEAIENLDRSVQLDDSSAAALNYLGYLLADGGTRLEEARVFIEMALAIDPENGAYLDSMGWVLYRLKEYNQAREYLESAVQLMDVTEEENYVIYEHLGDVYYEIGLFQEAVEAWEEALELKYLSNIQRKIDNVRGELAK